jgi:hypothetical protein
MSSGLAFQIGAPVSGSIQWLCLDVHSYRIANGRFFFTLSRTSFHQRMIVLANCLQLRDSRSVYRDNQPGKARDRNEGMSAISEPDAGPQHMEGNRCQQCLTSHEMRKERVIRQKVI